MFALKVGVKNQWCTTEELNLIRSLGELENLRRAYARLLMVTPLVPRIKNFYKADVLVNCYFLKSKNRSWIKLTIKMAKDSHCTGTLFN